MHPQTARQRANRAYGDAAAARPPSVVLVQVHDGMVDKLIEARTAILNGDTEARCTATTKVAAVIEALHLALDEEQGGAIARNLGQLYGHFVQRLTAINLENDPGICDELIARLRELRRGWAAHLEPGPVATTPEAAAFSA
jgi:flagellar protein FliS